MADKPDNPQSRHQIERKLCAIWREVLDLDTDVMPDNDFFELGGDSLDVVDVVLSARKQGIEFRSSAIFRNPTPAQLAESIAAA
jgi:acyl carrier protein